jgi:hypothetical protein
VLFKHKKERCAEVNYKFALPLIAAMAGMMDGKPVRKPFEQDGNYPTPVNMPNPYKGGRPRKLKGKRRKKK